MLVEKALDAEPIEHLDHDRHGSVANASGNSRNGKSKKTLKGEFGELPIGVPRDRLGSFEPQLIPKHRTHWNGLDDKIISLCARGMAVREIQGHLQERCGKEASPSLISSVTDAVSEEVKVWQVRPLDATHPIVYLDCIHVKVREGAVRVKALVQRCIVHMVCHSLNHVSWKRRQDVAADLRYICQAATAEEAELRLGAFEAKWDADCLPIGQSWRRNWGRLTRFFDYPAEIRKVTRSFTQPTPSASVRMGLRKLSKNRGSFPSDEALTKLFDLALRNISQKWTMPTRD